MTHATQLTRSGDLLGATQAIQRALHGDASESGQRAPTTHAPTSSASNSSGVILDGLTRFVDETETAANEPTALADASLAHEPQSDLKAARAAPQDERWFNGTFRHQGRTLAYKLYLPPPIAGTAPKPSPLVLMLHGCTQGAADFAAGTQMNALARESNVAVVYPEQTKHANSQKCWNWFKSQHQQRGRGEPAVLAALVQHLVAEHDLDASRVYVAGLSAGGAMADILGHCYPDVFAAVGVHSGLPCGAASDLPSALAAMRSGATHARAPAAVKVPPTIVFHGGRDTTVNPSNGLAIFKRVLGSHGDTGALAARAQASEGRSVKGQDFTRTIYVDATGTSTAELWDLRGAGHAWSGGSVQGSYTDPRGVDASAEMLRFFLAHRQQSDDRARST